MSEILSICGIIIHKDVYTQKKQRDYALSNIFSPWLNIIERQQLNRHDLYHKILQMTEISIFAKGL